jgi:hypothetical protein
MTRNAHNILVDISISKCPHRRLRGKWKDYFTLDLSQMDCENQAWTEMPQDLVWRQYLVLMMQKLQALQSHENEIILGKNDSK